MPISKHFSLAWRADIDHDKHANDYFVCHHGTVLGQEIVVSYAYKQLKQVVLPQQGGRPERKYKRCKRNQQTRRDAET